MPNNKTVRYYSKLGSRLGYGIVAGGHRHFGYHRDKNYWYIPKAANAMIDYLAKYAEIKPGYKVLDAGCGEGKASLRIAKNTGATVHGIDLVPRSIKIAKKAAAKTKLDLKFELGDFNNLPFDDNSFDLVFALETFTHSPDPKKTLKEFWRVLKPGGKIVLFDYSVKDINTLPKETKTAMLNIAKGTNCPSFIKIFHNYYEVELPKLGMSKFEVLNQTDAVMKSLKQLYLFSWLIFWLLKITRRVNNHPNVLIGHFGKIWASNDTWRYITVKISKPTIN